ncbi:Transketolase [Labilithrix luteola]|uniref:Transketolase n=1 Tax=Labilithrix luteola TaxID=1391654 RepID=A0A0K1PMS6_9BACT|nr:transketolase [Labilithrix luteola]AKU94828.1 Transketolase [Labilithrix luteola]
MTDSSTIFAELRRDALAIRKMLLAMHYRAKSGHIGTGLSSIDILALLHKVWLGEDDAFLLSKGHGASALYATLHHYGRISDEEIATYYQDGTLFPAHPAPRAVPAIVAATGSLGHGLSIAAGIAYARKHVHEQTTRVAALLSDGECNEGSVWEAAAFASHHGLSNLLVVVDANGLQGFGTTREVLDMEPFADKWRAFGFATHEIDGHDFEQLHAATRELDPQRPTCIIARTRKGNGVGFMEGKLEWHYLPMTEAQYRDALRSLDGESS